ncbi:MAG TPA: alpha/beta hydrolase [Steroidobacteraceae bacterium]|nr:alpha/beta hydrolase [Steroidobacteraceae bacterium]
MDLGGRRVHLLCAGHGAPTVVLEPSGLGTVLAYQPVIAALSPGQRVCAHDRAGQGWSDATPDPVDARHQADDLARLLDSAGEAPPYLLVASSAAWFGLPRLLDPLEPGLSGSELAGVETRWQAAQAQFAQQVHAPPVSRVHSGHLIASDRPDAVVAAVRGLLNR